MDPEPRWGGSARGNETGGRKGKAERKGQMWFLQLMDFLGRREEGERCSAKGGRQGGAAHRRTGARDLRGVVLVHVSGAIPLQEVANLRGRCVRDRLEAGALADTAQAPRPSPDRATADPRLGRRRGCGGVRPGPRPGMYLLVGLFNVESAGGVHVVVVVVVPTLLLLPARRDRG